MNAIHIIMATSASANPHNSPNQRIESIIRKRKLSAITFLGLFEFNFFVVRVFYFILVFGILLITAGSLLFSFESQRFSVSFIVFGYLFINNPLMKFFFIFLVSLEFCLLLCIGYQQRKS